MQTLARHPSVRRPRSSALLAAGLGALLAVPALANESLSPALPLSSGAMGRAVDLKADRALVGVPQTPGGSAAGPGLALVFRDVGSGWVEEAALSVPGSQQGDAIGGAVALGDDTAVLAAPGDDVVAPEAGAVHVFVRNGTSWSLQQTLRPALHESFDSFGDAVSLDGERLAVGRPGRGTVEIFERSGSTWAFSAEVQPATGIDFAAEFGAALVLDGERLFVGAPGFDSLGYDSGGVYAFERVGSAWQQTALVEASDGATVTAIGTSLALVDGQLIAGSANDTVYVWDTVAGALIHERRLYPSDPDNAGSLWGQVLAADAEWLAVGSPNDGLLGQSAGAVHMFRRAHDEWYAQGLLVSDEASAFDEFGFALALDAARVLVGAPGEDSAAQNGGAAEQIDLLPEAPWSDLGQGLAGASLPSLEPAGTLQAGALTTLAAAFGPADATAALVIGLTELAAPFKGGVLVPEADLLALGLPLDADGALDVAFTWPSGVPAGISTWYQVWIADDTAPFGFSATNAVLGVTP